MKTRLFIIDDHVLLREGMKTLLNKVEDLEIVGDAGDGESAFAGIKALKPDIMIVDVSMPDMNGVDIVRQVYQDNPDVKALALSMYADREHVSGMIAAGAKGYVLKNGPIEDLIQAIHTVMDGNMYFSQKIQQILATTLVQGKITEMPVFPSLTEKELETLRMLANGLSIKEIAYQLGVTTRTIEMRRKRIMEKTNTHNIVDLVKYAIRNKIIDL